MRDRYVLRLTLAFVVSVSSSSSSSSSDFVGSPSTLHIGVHLLRKHGRLLLVGLFGGEARLSIPLVPLKALTIKGIHTGNYKDLVELVSLVDKVILIYSIIYLLGMVEG